MQITQRSHRLSFNWLSWN